MSEDDVLELSFADEGEEEEELSLSLAGDEESVEEAGATEVAMPSGGWSITLKNPTIKIEKLVIKRND